MFSYENLIFPGSLINISIAIFLKFLLSQLPTVIACLHLFLKNDLKLHFRARY